MRVRTRGDIRDLQGANVIYLDENSMNRTLAELLLRNAGVRCRSVETVGAMIDMMNHGPFNLLVLELNTIASDPEGLALAQRAPRFRDVPLVVVGDDEEGAKSIGATHFVPFPLDPVRFLRVITEALREYTAEPGDAIRRTALLARIEGKPEKSETAAIADQIDQIDQTDKTEKPLVLVVDDSAMNRRFISESLEDEFSVSTAVDGTAALVQARSTPAPALILLDVEMPGIDGYETCRLLKEDPRTRSIPIIFLTSLSKEENEERGLSLGAVDYIRKPFSVPILKARVRTQLELLRYQKYLETLVEERTRALLETQREVIFRLAQAAEYRDNDTGSHIKRIGYFSAILAERLNFPRAETDILFYASSMHDIGKIGIPDNILLKPGKLSDEEWVVMKRHPTIGAGLLEGHPAELLRVAARVARTHHEKWDGTGYPVGLAGEQIPMEGRIVAICDVFDALLSVRPYKRAWTADEALDEINRLSDHHFDPAIVRIFNDSFPEFVKIKKRFQD